jgi:hypothetical protein
LPHPDPDADRERKIDVRESAESESEAEDGEADGEPKVTITVKDAGGEVIRTYRDAVYQGINRVTWNMRRDGARALPGPIPQDYKDGVPAGPEVPPGRYSITLALDHPDSQATVASIDVRTVADPRSKYSQTEIEQNYATQLDLLKLELATLDAVERIVKAREEIGTITKLIRDRKGADENHTLMALKEQASSVEDRLDDVEKRFRMPPATKGYGYTADKVADRLTMAKEYVGSTFGAPSAAAETYIRIARSAVEQGLSDLNELIGGELEAFRKAVDSAGIGLLSDIEPVSVAD